jgi:hypothetical protein
MDRLSLAWIGSAWHGFLRFNLAWQDLSQLFVNSVQILTKVGGLASHEDPVSANKIKTSSQNIKNVKTWF